MTIKVFIDKDIQRGDTHAELEQLEADGLIRIRRDQWNSRY